MKKCVQGYEGLYWIDEHGVITRRDGTELKGSVNSYGYRVVSLSKNGRKKDHKVHRLLAVAFIPNPAPGIYDCINHKDGNKLNNALKNLEWCTRKQNCIHSMRELGNGFDERTVMQTTMAGKFVAVWKSASVAATFVDGTPTLIYACCKGTAPSAYGYLWSYCDEASPQLAFMVRKAELVSEGERLLQSVSELEAKTRDLATMVQALRD